jgi:hypothetical protein
VLALVLAVALLARAARAPARFSPIKEKCTRFDLQSWSLLLDRREKVGMTAALPA